MDTQTLTPSFLTAGAASAAPIELDRSALLPTYVAESEENLVALEESLLALEKSGGDEELLATIFRAAHTLKGNSESLGFGTVAICAHAVENVLDRLRHRTLEPSSTLVSVLLDANDAMRSMVAVVAAGGEPSLASHGEVMARLAELAASAAPVESERTRAANATITPARAKSRTLRVDLATLDRIVTHLEELSIARVRLRAVFDQSGAVVDAADALAETERHFDDLRERVMRLRLVPVGPVFRAQARAVRDLAASCGKQVRLATAGDDVEVDTTVLEALKDPITHMVRNALDHGIEPPDARSAAGKDPTGTITLRARHESGRLVIEVEDDGAGFRRDRIVAHAREMGLLRGDASSLSDGDVYRLVFAPGFSTAEKVTDLSGRGVGMDVVAHNVTALKGTIDVRSTEGFGSTVELRLPLTLSIVEGFTVSAADEAYVIPLESVRECIELPLGLGRHEDACGVFSLRGGVLPFVRLRDLFELGGAPPARENIVVVEHGGKRAGLAVDALRGRGQAVVKPLAALLRGSDAISGTTLLGDGRVALILDVPALLRGVESKRRARARATMEST